MKRTLSLALFLTFILIGYATASYSIKKESTGYYVVLKFSKTENTISLSEKFSTLDQCVNSSDYQLHTLANKESGLDIRCLKTTPTYKL